MKQSKTEKMIDIVTDLTNKYKKNVIISFRKDGGILIRSINGTKYSGAKGNAVARQIVGAKLTEKQHEQRQNAFRFSPIQLKKNEAKNLYAEIRKIVKAKKAKNPKYKANWTASRIKNNIRENGLNSAVESLKSIKRSLEGFVAQARVEIFIAYIENLNEPAFEPVIEWLQENILNVNDENMMAAHDDIYDFTHHDISAEVSATRALAHLKGSYIN